MVSPLCEVKDGSGAYGSTAAGVDVTPGHTITIRLADSNVNSWEIQCITTDDTHVAATIQGGLTIDSLNKTASFTAPAAGAALRFRSRVNGGVGADGTIKPTYSTTFCIYTLVGSNRVVASDETTESGEFGWVAVLNKVVRGASPSFTGTVTFQGDGYRILSIPGSLVTVGAVTDTIALFDILPNTSVTCDFTAAMAAASPSVGTAGRWDGKVTYQRTTGINSGNAVIVGSAEYGTPHRTVVGDGVVFVLSTNAIHVAATSADSDNRNWNCEFRVVETLKA